MEISSLTQSALTSPGLLTPKSAETEFDTTGGPTSPLNQSISESLSITQNNIFIAREVMTQQMDIALEIKSPTSFIGERSIDSEHHIDDLVNKVINKIHDEISSDDGHEHDEHHQAQTVKSVQFNVNQAFEQSVQVLSQLDIMNTAVASDIAQTQSQVNRAIDQVSMSTQSMSLSSESATRELSTSLQLTTQDGDIITIDLTRSQSLAAGSLQDASGSLIYASSASETQLSISIQGDLSEKESHAIKEVIEDINKLAEKMFNGEMSDAMEKLSELDINTKQLSGLALSMSSNISYQAVSAYSQVSQMTVSSSNYPAPASIPAAPTSSTPAAVADSLRGSDIVTDSVADTPAPTTSQPTVQLTKPASMVAVDVAIETADVVQLAYASNSFDDPFSGVDKLFDQLAELFSFEHDNRKDETKHFIKDLFHDLVQELKKDDDD